ncbi:MAG: endoribonuclease MazF [Deltaproteobacteria bacterium]|nr:endoribonuclease MazF [Deltaproteobacteria bacterium]
MGRAGRQRKLVSAARYVPDRGDILWLTFDPQAGHEQAGRRPALVLSPAAYNRRAKLALVCPITNQAKGYPFEVALPVGLPMTGVILADHLKSADWAVRRAEFVAKAPADILADVIAKLRPLLGV